MYAIHINPIIAVMVASATISLSTLALHSNFQTDFLACFFLTSQQLIRSPGVTSFLNLAFSMLIKYTSFPLAFSPKELTTKAPDV